MLYDKIKTLLLKNDKKRPLNSVASVSEIDSESIASDEQDIIVLSQSPNKKGKTLKPAMSGNSQHINENIQSTPGRGTKRKLSDITNKR